MAISKNDCLFLLTELKDKGINTTEQINSLIKESQPTIDIIKFINDNRELDLTEFYRKIRKSYNEKPHSLVADKSRA